MTAPEYAASKEVAKANREFYRAFERRDLAAMRDLWRADDHVKCVHPGGEVLVGAERVLASWQAIFAGSPELRFELADLMIEVLGDLGWATLVERIHSPDGQLLSQTACTNLFRRDAEDGAPAWRMVLHHASPIARRFFDAG